MSQPHDLITVGKISGVFGLKGWVKVFSHTGERDGILAYNPWFLRQPGGWKLYKLLAGQIQGKVIVAQLEGVNEREQAQALVGCEIAISRTQLKPTKADEYYWADLIGLEVITVQQVVLGKVECLFETGSNDVMIVKGERERWIPWIMGEVVKTVDLDAKTIQVDWDPDF